MNGRIVLRCHVTRCDPFFLLECKAGCPVDVLLRPDDIEHDDASPMLAEVTQRRLAARIFSIPCA